MWRNIHVPHLLVSNCKPRKQILKSQQVLDAVRTEWRTLPMPWTLPNKNKNQLYVKFKIPHHFQAFHFLQKLKKKTSILAKLL